MEKYRPVASNLKPIMCNLLLIKLNVDSSSGHSNPHAPRNNTEDMTSVFSLVTMALLALVSRSLNINVVWLPGLNVRLWLSLFLLFVFLLLLFIEFPLQGINKVASYLLLWLALCYLKFFIFILHVTTFFFTTSHFSDRFSHFSRRSPPPDLCKSACRQLSTADLIFESWAQKKRAPSLFRNKDPHMKHSSKNMLTSPLLVISQQLSETNAVSQLVNKGLNRSDCLRNKVLNLLFWHCWAEHKLGCSPT